MAPDWPTFMAIVPRMLKVCGGRISGQQILSQSQQNNYVPDWPETELPVEITMLPAVNKPFPVENEMLPDSVIASLPEIRKKKLIGEILYGSRLTTTTYPLATRNPPLFVPPPVVRRLSIVSSFPVTIETSPPILDPFPA